MKPFDFAILGAGSFGTAVAAHLSDHDFKVVLWGRDPASLKKMASTQLNKQYLPNIKLPATLSYDPDLLSAINLAKHLVIAVPSHAFDDLVQELPANLTEFIWLTKGLSPINHQFLHQSILQRFPNAKFCVISGPSFAKEIAQNLPTCVTLASNDSSYAKQIQTLFCTPTLRVYTSADYIGVQIAGAMKNVLAIAVGISDGLGFGANARAALITRGLEEMKRLGQSFNADQKTFMGLSGLGDLLLTATDNQSRNRRFGLALGQGKSNQQAIDEIGQVVEGKQNAEQVCELGKIQYIELPICSIVQKIIHQHLSPQEAVSTLLSRPPTEE